LTEKVENSRKNSLQKKSTVKGGEKMAKATPMTTKEAAIQLGVKPSTLEVWRVYGKGPKYLKLGRLVKYRLADLESFLEQSLRSSTS
jgi:hypothetical protein